MNQQPDGTSSTNIESARQVSDRVHWVLAALLPIMLLAPFVNKPVHIDDTVYIAIAKQIVKHPLDYYGFSLNWEGVDLPVYAWHRNPPLANYYLAAIGALFGWKEWVLHLAYMLPALLAGLGTFAMARRLCTRPAIALWATVCTPAFVVTGTSLMLDMWLLAFFVLALAALVEGFAAERLRWFILAGLFAGLAAWSKYFGAALLPLFIVYAWLKPKRPRYWWLCLLLPTLMVAAEQAHYSYQYGRPILAAAAQSVSHDRPSRPWWVWLLVGLSFSGGCNFSVTQIGAVLWSGRLKAAGAVLAASIAFLLYELNAHEIRVQTLGFDLPAVALALYAVFILGGTQLFSLVVLDVYTRRDAESWLIALWVMGTFLFSTYVTWSVNARSILPLVPAVAMLAMRRLDVIAVKDRRKTERRILISLALSALISLLVARVDMEWAQSARDAAGKFSELAKAYPGTVYFQGHWGFQHYMSEAGVPPLDFEATTLQPGDIVICPENNANVRPLPPEFVSDRTVESFPVNHRMATMSVPLGAGFYSDLWGPLPFALGLKKPPDNYYIYGVAKAGKPFAGAPQ